MRFSAEKLKDVLLEALYPSRVACCLCGREARLDERGLCADCASKNQTRPYFNARFLYESPLISGYSSGLVYSAHNRNAMLALKYGGRKYLAEALAAFMEIPPEWNATVVVPVPLHERRRAQRGFNQSELLAMAVAKRCGLRCDTNMLVRKRYTQTQTRLGRNERRRNLAGAFEARDCLDERVVLVDDVCTTGSTLHECAKALILAGAEAVFALSAYKA